MKFETQIPEWKNEGTEPSDTLKTNGFKEGYKPPAGIFNWFWSIITKAIAEIQANLSNVDNTKDSEKSVNFASEAGIGRKLKYALTVRFKGGDTEGTDKWTFDGSTSRSVNITPDKIGARPTNKPNIVINAVRGQSEDGTEIYTATNSNITELYNGLEITIIPNESNETLSPRLKINDFEDNAIRLALSFNCAATNALKSKFFQAGRPITLKYHSELNLGIQGQGAWIFADRLKVSAQDLYGSVPVESGGTGASTEENARKNLGVAPAIESEDFAGCYYRIIDGETEWINPPMNFGVEYRTTERFNHNEPVYVYAVQFGTLPNNSTMGITIPSGAMGIVSIDGIVYEKSENENHKIANPICACSGLTDVWFDANSQKINVKTNADMSGKQMSLTLKYLK